MVLIIPYQDYNNTKAILDDPSIQLLSVLKEQLNQIIETDEVIDDANINDSIYHIFIVVKSTINQNFDFLLEGVITNEKNQIK